MASTIPFGINQTRASDLAVELNRFYFLVAPGQPGHFSQFLSRARWYWRHPGWKKNRRLGWCAGVSGTITEALQ